MKTPKGIRLLTVDKLRSGLRKFEKRHLNDDVVCYPPDGTLCYISNLEIDEDGDLCISLDDEIFDEAFYTVDMLLADLEHYKPQTKVYMSGCGMHMTINIVGKDGAFEYDDANDVVGCDGIVFDEYEEEERHTGWLTEAEKRELAEIRRKEKREDKLWTIALVILTLALVGGFIYGVYALITHTGATWRNVLWTVVCLFLTALCSLRLYYDSKESHR